MLLLLLLLPVKCDTHTTVDILSENETFSVKLPLYPSQLCLVFGIMLNILIVNAIENFLPRFFCLGADTGSKKILYIDSNVDKNQCNLYKVNGIFLGLDESNFK